MRPGRLFRRLLFSLARSRLGGLVVGLAFAHASRLIPLGRVYESDRLVAFPHPGRPAARGHTLIVPKRRIADVVLALELLSVAEIDEFVEVGRRVAEQAGIDGPVLIVNWGARQAVRQVHFHVLPHSVLGRARGETFGGAPTEVQRSDSSQLPLRERMRELLSDHDATSARAFSIVLDGIEGGPGATIVRLDATP